MSRLQSEIRDDMQIKFKRSFARDDGIALVPEFSRTPSYLRVWRRIINRHFGYGPFPKRVLSSR
jgi:hypothetical protein